MKKTFGLIGIVLLVGMWWAVLRPAMAQTAGGRGYLGATVDDRNDRGRGVRVLGIRPGGPADRAGLRPDDLIVGAGGARVRQMADLTAVLDLLAPGDKVPIEVLRAGSALPQKGEVTLGQSPPGLPATVPGTFPPRESVPAPPAGPLPGPPAEGPTITPPPSPGGLVSDSARIDQLQRRIDQLERRVEQLEQTLAQLRAK
ncbi:MAG: PDZ domain-containing protein [Thermoguttaceae bacterium]|jgi:membrane-associated protease RseP (regulator of RpoE activity)